MITDEARKLFSLLSAEEKQLIKSKAEQGIKMALRQDYTGPVGPVRISVSQLVHNSIRQTEAEKRLVSLLPLAMDCIIDVLHKVGVKRTNIDRTTMDDIHEGYRLSVDTTTDYARSAQQYIQEHPIDPEAVFSGTSAPALKIRRTAR